MKKKLSFVMSIIFSLVLLLSIGGCDTNNMSKQNIEPEQAVEWLQGFIGKIKPKEQIILGYYENPWAGTSEITGSFPSLREYGKNLSAIGPFWYKVGNDGSLDTKDSQEVIDAARKMGLKIYPLVTNKREATENILGNPTVRSKAVDNLVKMVKEKKYDGINIDFELLPPKQRDNLTAFMAELYPRMKAMNKTVVISVFPQIDVHEDVSGAYDYPKLAQNADYLQIMTYDNHWSTSAPGAIAPIDWYEKNIQYAIEQCGTPDKVLVGVSAYGYDWDANNKGETITYPDATVLAVQKGAEIKYDETVQAPYFKYDDHEVWFEDARSVAAKLNVVAKYNVAGIAIWRLGQESPEIWGKVNEIFPK